MSVFSGRGRDRTRPRGLVALLLGLMLALAACRGPQRPVTQTAPPFVPPTAAPTATAAPPAATTHAVTTPQPTACVPGLAFVADETIPDGTQVPPGATLLKAWRVRNVGTCPWGPGYTLRFVSGAPLDATPEQPLFPAAPGEEARVEVRFHAPPEPGVYQSVWQAFTPQGAAFGDPIFIIVEVVTATPTPSPGPSPTAAP